MQHASTASPDDLFSAPAGGERARWISLLARAPVALLARGLGEQAALEPVWLKAPETGLMMVRARAGGQGEKFNLGEATVTRCVLRLPQQAGEPAVVGVAYVLGRSHQHARLAALADALLQTPGARARLQTQLLAPLRAWLAGRQQALRERAAQTRVDFFTLAREAGEGG